MTYYPGGFKGGGRGKIPNPFKDWNFRFRFYQAIIISLIGGYILRFIFLAFNWPIWKAEVLLGLAGLVAFAYIFLIYRPKEK